MYCATPAPRLVNAGINIQNHHPRPTCENASAIDTTRNASPEKSLVIAPSQWIGLPFLSSTCRDWASLPDSASVTFPRSVPQLRQNLPVSGFCVPHFGQNISFISFGPNVVVGPRTL